MSPHSIEDLVTLPFMFRTIVWNVYIRLFKCKMVCDKCRDFKLILLDFDIVVNVLNYHTIFYYRML